MHISLVSFFLVLFLRFVIIIICARTCVCVFVMGCRFLKRPNKATKSSEASYRLRDAGVGSQAQSLSLFYSSH